VSCGVFSLEQGHWSWSTCLVHCFKTVYMVWCVLPKLSKNFMRSFKILKERIRILDTWSTWSGAFVQNCGDNKSRMDVRNSKKCRQAFTAKSGIADLHFELGRSQTAQVSRHAVLSCCISHDCICFLQSEQLNSFLVFQKSLSSTKLKAEHPSSWFKESKLQQVSPQYNAV